MLRLLVSLLLCACAGCYLAHGREGEAPAPPPPPPTPASDASPRPAPDAEPTPAPDTLPPPVVDAGSVDAATPPDPCADGTCAVAAELDGLRWELPCEEGGREICDTVGRRSRLTTLSGERGALYEVELRFRGVVETKRYEGGTGVPPLNRGGDPDPSVWNVYALRTTAPAGRLYLNAGAERPRHCIPIDVTTTVLVEGGSDVILEAFVYDGHQIRNRDPSGAPITVPGVPPYPDAYDGQFIQMDVLSVTRAR